MSLEEALNKLEPEQVATLLHGIVTTASVDMLIGGLAALKDMDTNGHDDRKRFLIRTLALRVAVRVMEPGYLTEEPCPNQHPSPN